MSRRASRGTGRQGKRVAATDEVAVASSEEEPMGVKTAHRSNPGADIDAMVEVINQLVALANQTKTKVNETLAKLDADSGVSDTNYAAQKAVTADSADSVELGY